MTIYSADGDGNVIVVFDSRWRFPELLGYSPGDPQYAELQKLWEERTGKKIAKGESGKESDRDASQSIQDQRA